jgi:poly(3-hydroxybutyrate) depolymerase
MINLLKTWKQPEYAIRLGKFFLVSRVPVLISFIHGCFGKAKKMQAASDTTA